MATGDAGAAKGLRVIQNTKDLKLGYDDLNKKADEIAAEIDARVAADALKADKADFIISTTTPPVRNGAIWFKPQT